MPWAYDPKKPNEKLLVADEQAALERGLILETEEDKAKWSKRKKQFDNGSSSLSHCPKTADLRNRRGDVKPYVYFQTKDGKHLNIAQNAEGRRILADAVAEKYGSGASVEGDF